MELHFLDLFVSPAYAQAGSGSTIMSLLPMLLIFVVFYFLLIRPQQKRQKEHKAMVANIAKGDEVMTNGGLLGKVTKVGDAYVSLELGADTNVKLQTSAIAQVLPKGTIKSA